VRYSRFPFVCAVLIGIDFNTDSQQSVIVVVFVAAAAALLQSSRGCNR